MVLHSFRSPFPGAASLCQDDNTHYHRGNVSGIPTAPTWLWLLLVLLDSTPNLWDTNLAVTKEPVSFEPETFFILCSSTHNVLAETTI